MATDATGTPTTLGIPKYATNTDPPSGRGFNAAMDSIDSLLRGAFTTPSASDADLPVWDAATGRWKPSSVKTPAILATVAIPAGSVIQYGGASSPTGWVLCDGTAVSRSTFSGLFSILNTAYGVGDGSTTFNLPDYRGRVPVGYAASGGHTDVSTLGLNEGSALANRRPKHPHTNGITITGAPGVGSLALPNHGHSVTDPTHAHSANMNNDGAAGGGNNFVGVDHAVNVGASVAAAFTGISVGNPTSNPAITGAPSVGSLGTGGTIGAAGTATDSAAYLVINYIIKT